MTVPTSRIAQHFRQVHMYFGRVGPSQAQKLQSVSASCSCADSRRANRASSVPRGPVLGRMIGTLTFRFTGLPVESLGRGDVKPMLWMLIRGSLCR